MFGAGRGLRQRFPGRYRPRAGTYDSSAVRRIPAFSGSTVRDRLAERADRMYPRSYAHGTHRAAGDPRWKDR